MTWAQKVSWDLLKMGLCRRILDQAYISVLRWKEPHRVFLQPLYELLRRRLLLVLRLFCNSAASGLTVPRPCPTPVSASWKVLTVHISHFRIPRPGDTQTTNACIYETFE